MNEARRGHFDRGIWMLLNFSDRFAYEVPYIYPYDYRSAENKLEKVV